MEHEIILQKLELLSLGPMLDLSAHDAKKLLDYVKNLERCLADALALAHETSSRLSHSGSACHG